MSAPVPEEETRQPCEEFLQNLQVDYIDLYYHHRARRGITNLVLQYELTADRIFALDNRHSGTWNPGYLPRIGLMVVGS